MSHQIKKNRSSLQNMLDDFDKNIPPNPLDLKLENKTEENAFEQFLDGSAFVSLTVGDLVRGTIVEIRGDKVIVDIKYKSEGILESKEFLKAEELEIGKELEAIVENLSDDSGLVIISKEKADIRNNWNRVSNVYESGESVEGRVIAKVKGGYDVDIGVKAFLPQSQVDFGGSKKGNLQGKTLPFKVIKFNKKRGNIVLSRRAILEESREKFFVDREGPLQVGDVVKGFVKNVTEYGAFIDLGGIDGLLHISDMSWSRPKSPESIVEVGQSLEVKVLKVNMENSRVSLGLKQLHQDPWQDVVTKYPEGSKVKCEVAKVINYGAFVTFENGLDGFIHIAELSWSRDIESAEDVLKVGQEVEGIVLGYNDETRRVRVSLKKMTDSPWKKLMDECPLGTVIEGKVESVADFGIFVSLTDGISGLVHMSDFSWVKSYKPGEKFSVGDTVTVVVLDIDVDNEKVRLGIKQLEENPWDKAKDKYKIGTVHKAKIVKASEFGAFVELEPGVGGLIHISELSSSRVESVTDVVEVGSEVEAEIISVDLESRKIGLSLKALKLSEDKEAMKLVNKDSSSNLGDSLSSDLRETLEGLGKNSEDKKTEPVSDD